MIFEYEAQQDDELDLKIGDLIKDVQTVSHLKRVTLTTIYVCFVDFIFYRWMRAGVRGH